MEFVFGAPATGAGSQYDLSFSATEDGHSRQSESPSTYDTQLFPSSLASSLHSRTQPSLHPLLRSIQLPPINSLVSTLSHGESNSAQERNARTIAASGSLVAGSNGNIIRVNDRFQAHEGSDRLARRTARPTTLLPGWVDDGLPPDRATEDFSIALGSAIEALQEQSQSQDQATQNNDNPLNEDSAPPEAPNLSEELGGESSTQNVEVADAAEDSPGENVDDADASNNEPPPAQESQSEAAEVSSAMAAGLTISQPASDNAPILPNPSIPNDQAVVPTDSGNNAEGTSDAVMAEEHSVGENGEEDVEEEMAPEEEASDEEAPDDQEAESNESNHEENDTNNDDLVNESNQEENVANNHQLVCPPGKC